MSLPKLLKVCIFVAFVMSSASAAVRLQGDFTSMTFSGGNIVALDFSDDIYTSDDNGQTFTLRQTTTEAFEDVQALGDTVIAVGIDGLILRSTDNGLNWSTATSPTILGTLKSSAGRDAGPSDNVWLAVGFDGSDAPVFSSTNDGASWSKVATLTFADLRDVTWTGNRWVAVGSDDLGFDGVVYHSTDGVSWSASTLPALVSPLSAVTSDGAGNVLVAGENGELLRSTDDGLTFTGLSTNLSEDLNAIVVDSSGVFYVGGVDQVFLEVNIATINVVVPPAPSAPEIEDLVLIDDEPALGGNYEGIQTRTIPLVVVLTEEGLEDYRLTIEESLSARVYHVETTDDLVNGVWTDVPGKSASGTGSGLFFDVTVNGTQRFWRIIEF